MRAERDEDDLRPLRTQRGPQHKTERRLAYEIALGIILGGAGLWLLNAGTVWLMAKFMLQNLQLQLPG
jgi:hypothetical protein